MRLYNRRAVITIDAAARFNQANLDALGVKPALRVVCDRDHFDCRFDIHKDLKSKPNRATIDIFNLNPDHRDSLSERALKGPSRVRVDAGYGDDDGLSRIFEGDLSILYHEHNGPDVITRVEMGDGDHLVQTSRISKSWGPGIGVDSVIQELADEMGIGTGNLNIARVGAALEGWGPTFTQGTVASGPIFQEMTRICRSAGLEWSIQDGTIQFLVADKALSATAVLVTSNTGMEGFAAIDHRRRLHVKMRMIPGVFPGRKIQLADKSVWRVVKAHYRGETHGRSWGIAVEALAVT